jgi:hypothetical protein
VSQANGECCVVMLHHQPLETPLVARHIEAIHAQGLDCFPLSFGPGKAPRQPAEGPEYHGYAGWRFFHMDHLLYDWFEARKPDYDRFMLVEYDTHFTMHPREFYGAKYDADMVAGWFVDARVPSALMPAGNTYESWFQGTPGTRHFVTHGHAEHLRGVMPVVLMISRRCLAGMTREFLANPWCWDDCTSEMRLGTLAAMAGYEPTTFTGPRGRPGHHFLYANPREEIDGPGIWHSIKDETAMVEWNRAHGG